MPDSLPRYENPLDLLLDLLHQQQIPLAEVSLAPITAQYLDYMRRAGELDVNLGIEFAHTAAVLIHLKSKALLPGDPLAVEPHPDECAVELVRQLLTRDEARYAATLLADKKLFEDSIHSAPQASSKPGLNPFSLWDLTQEFRAFARQDWNPDPVYVPEMQGPSIAEMLEWLNQRLPPIAVSLADLLAEQPTPKHQAALFLAILESARLQQISLRQKRPFAEVYINHTN